LIPLTAFAIAEQLSEFSSANYVLGANGMPPTSWANILYDYFIKNYQGTRPRKWKYNDETEKTELIFSRLNTVLEAKEVYHVNVIMGPIAEDRKGGAANTKCEETYIFFIYVKDKHTSELFPEIQNIMHEIRRMFIREYVSYDIAGIATINHFRATGLAPPNTGMNPNESHWLLPCSFKIFYSCNSYFNPTEADLKFNAHRYPAGQWRKEADHRWALFENTTFTE
jgi:hypothetical protein